MNRPYIFCHMMTALDGKIMGSYMETPQGSAAGDVFYEKTLPTLIQPSVSFENGRKWTQISDSFENGRIFAQ